MAFTTYDGIISALGSNADDEWNFFKIFPSAVQGAGSWHSPFLGVGSPGAGTTPAGTPGAACDNLAGSMFFTARGGYTKNLLTFGALSTVAGNLMLYDRLSHVGGVIATGTGSKTVSSTALTRYTGTAAAVVEVWGEVTTASTTTAAVMHLLSYTDDAGNTGHVGGNVTMPATATVVGYAFKFPLAAGDKGVRAVSTVNIDTATTNMVINVALIRPLAVIPLPANTWVEKDMVLQLAALPQIFDTASLGLYFQAAAAGTPTVYGTLRFAYS